MYIFIIGNAQSGASWVARILGSFDNVRVTFEKKPQFGLAFLLATRKSIARQTTIMLRDVYRDERLATTQRWYADKSHTNIWNVAELKRAFRNQTVKFIGIQREMYTCISSMRSHDRVMERDIDWRTFSVPNNFLGIKPRHIQRYDGLTDLQKATLRWLSHKQRMQQLSRGLNSQEFLLLNYEEMVTDFATNLTAIANFIGEPEPTDPPLPNRSLQTYADLYNMAELADIQAATELFFLP